jgi:hypothetical protein
LITTFEAAPEIDALASIFPIDGFVLHGREPVLVDTGAVVEREESRDRPAVGHRPGRPQVDLADRG